MSGEASTPLSRAELVALLAMLSATVAFAIDAMLPVLPDIGAALSPQDLNRAQLVVASFVAGMGLGTLFAGPLSDAFGRRRIAAAGALVFLLGALAGALAPSLELLLIARFLQGLGASGPRVASLALARDLFSGRQMARILSFIMIVFALVPVIAPSIGAAVASAFGWRAIFVLFALFSVISISWLLLRQPETLPPERRRPFTPGMIAAGLAEVYSHRSVVLAIAVQCLVYAMLFSALMSSQAIIGVTFGEAERFPLWFGLIALLASGASALNAALVVRFGMRAVVKWALIMQCVAAGFYLAALTAQVVPAAVAFPLLLLWFTSVFFVVGLGIGNLNALALEPLGHMAGLASSIVSASATVAGVAIASAVGLAFDGTPVPLVAGVFIAALVALGLTLPIREVKPELGV